MLYGICLGRMGATEKQTIYLSLLFLGGITIVAFIVLRVLSYFNRKRYAGAEQIDTIIRKVKEQERTEQQIRRYDKSYGTR